MALKKLTANRGKRVPVATVAPRKIPADPGKAIAWVKAMLNGKMRNISWEFGIEDYRALAAMVKPLGEHDRAVVMAEVIKHLNEKDRLSRSIEAHFRELGFL